MKVSGWTMRSVGEPLALVEREEAPGPGEVLVEVAGCGLCHTDLGFLYDGVPTRHALPLVLGHEISGRVVATGPRAAEWAGAEVVVPAVIPCGECPACAAGHGSICPSQIFPGCDVHGGFATHVKVPARGLCRVPDLADPARNPTRLDLASLAVLADAVSTPYQAVHRTGLGAGDLAIFVGAGGVGGFGVQIAAAMGASVIAIDVREERLELLARHGADLALRSDQLGAKELRQAVRAFADERDVPSWRTFVFETSGTVPGEECAFGLLGHGGHLSIVGYTREKVALRLSNLMALDATASGNWGCLPELYPAALELVLSGRVALAPFVEHRPLAAINETLAEAHAGRTSRRVVLEPER